MTSSPHRDTACLEHCWIGTAFDGMCVGMIVTNPAGRVTWMNRSAQSQLAIDEEEARGELLTKVLRDPQMVRFWHEASSRDETTLGGVSLQWPRECDLKVNASRSLDPEGNCIGRVLLFCDVTSEHTVQIELSRETSRRLLDMTERWQGPAENSPSEGLTPQELKVLGLVGRGLSNDEIARTTHTAPSTVRTHLKHIYAKVGMTSRSEAIHYAIRAGLT